MNETRTDLKLLEKLRPFAHPESRSDAYLVVRDWIEQALGRLLDGKGENSFAPFYGYFQNPRELRQSFKKMVEGEFSGIELGKIDAVRVLARALRGALDATMQREGRPMLDERRIAPRVFDLLQFLFDLAPDEAFRWATRAVRDRNGFAQLRSANGRPAPIALYQESPATQFALGGCADAFEQAVFDWCVENSKESGAVKVCLSLMPRVLSSLNVGNSVKAAGRQAEVFARISKATAKDGETLARALDALAWRNARVAAGDPLDSTVGLQTRRNFMLVAEDLACRFAPGLRDRLESSGISNISDLVATSTPMQINPKDSTKTSTPREGFGGGGMLEALFAGVQGNSGGVAADAF